jgi:hypothetical protein
MVLYLGFSQTTFLNLTKTSPIFNSNPVYNRAIKNVFATNNQSYKIITAT